MSLRRRLPMLRWSMIRAADSNRNFSTTGQLGDGREAAAAWLFPLFGVAADQGVAASIAFGLLGTLQGVLYLPLWWRRH